MKKTLIILVLTSLFLTSVAHPIDLEMAQSVAAKFMVTNDMQLVSTYQTANNAAALYVFNTTDGFVIVAADDCETPIIGYSHEGRFDPNNVPVQMEDYLQDFVARIQYGMENHIAADETTARQWELVKTTGRLNDCKANTAVEPLLTEKWHQGCLYNNFCPTIEKVPCGHAEVGCVALAMGMIMHYWGYPRNGWGNHSYSYGGMNHTANFGNTNYDWSHMPDSLTDNSTEAEIEAVATLLYHCGVSLNMRYGANGSAANSRDVPDAMTHYFNYSRYLHGETRGSDNNAWLGLLKNDLDSLRPVFYSGHGSIGGHAFVCDGYDSNNLLHFNWGWGGPGNGYFALGNLNPNGYAFNDDHYAIFGIDPHYVPWAVAATVYPPSAGSIAGTGGYHIGEQCTLTAVPAENCEFNYWKKNGLITSYNTSFTFSVEGDIDDIEAHFSYQPIQGITAYHAPDTNNLNSPYVGIFWDYDNNLEWPILKEFETHGEDGVTTDGEYIYTSMKRSPSRPFELRKYSMDGDLLEEFEIEGVNTPNITSDGRYLYFGNNTIYSLYLYCLDFNSQTIIDSINVSYRVKRCAYDTENDGFWLSCTDRALLLVNRQGQTIVPQIIAPNYIKAFGPITAEDGNPYLLIITDRGIQNYDLTNNIFNDLHIHWSVSGACIGKYEGKDAVFVSYDYGILRIYEIKSRLARIMHYRLYRSDSEGHIVRLADEYTSTSYIDSTWSNISAGEYCFGISEVYFNGVESEIIWSDTIVKTDYGIDENSTNISVVYPNPTNDRLIVESPQHIQQCEVLTLDGKIIYSTLDCNERFEIQTHNWPSGIYIIRLIGDANTETKRFVKK